MLATLAEWRNPKFLSGFSENLRETLQQREALAKFKANL
jgi:hypothetical protein